jgi:hypothetical protein
MRQHNERAVIQLRRVNQSRRWRGVGGTYRVDRLNVQINGHPGVIAYISPKFREGLERYKGNSHKAPYGD